MRTLVLGGYGAVGTQVVAELGRGALAAGRDGSRADVVLDLADLDGYRAAVSEVDVVVNAAGVTDVRLASLATRAGASFVDVSASTSYAAELAELEPEAPVIVGVGLAPGLTGMLALDAHRAEPGPVDLAVLLGAGERHGPAATAWTYDLLGRRFPDPDGGHLRNYTRPSTFRLPGFGRRRLYRADFSDQHALTTELGVPVRTYFGLDSRLATAGLAALTWLPVRRAMHVPLPGGQDWLVAARAGKTLRWAAGRGQSRGTAIVTAAVARIAMDLPPGVHQGHRVLGLRALPTGPDFRLAG